MREHEVFQQPGRELPPKVFTGEILLPLKAAPKELPRIPIILVELQGEKVVEKQPIYIHTVEFVEKEEEEEEERTPEEKAIMAVGEGMIGLVVGVAGLFLLGIEGCRRAVHYAKRRSPPGAG